MSPSVAEKARHLGVYDFQDAVEVVQYLRTRREVPEYSLADLICFICLAP